MTEQLPFFVYGTLRPGGALACCWEDLGGEAHHDGDVLIDGYRLVFSHRRLFPYAIPAPPHHKQAVVGALVTVDPYLYRRLLATLDQVEGYPSHYDRRPVEAIMPLGQNYTAWLYTPTYATIDYLTLETAQPVPHNDWNHRHARV